MLNMNKLAVLAVVVLLPSLSIADTISGIEAVPFNNGSSIRIAGSFSAKTVAGPDISDRVHETAAYSGLSHGDVIPTQLNDGCATCPMPQRGTSGSAPEYYSTPSGVRASGRAYYSIPIKGYFFGPNITEGGGKYYLSWWIWSKYPLYDSGTSTVTPNKLVRFATPSEVYQGMEIQTQMTVASSVFGQCDNQLQQSSNPQYAAQKWWHIEMEYDNGANPAAGTGSYSVWWNGVLQYSFSGVYTCSGDVRRFARWGSDPNTYDYPVDQHFLWGDLYADNTWQRLVLCDQPTYAASTHRELQIPTAWSTGEITFTADTGSFASGATAYLYVIDANGTPSNFASVVIDQTGGGIDPTMTAPTGLTVSGGN